MKIVWWLPALLLGVLTSCNLADGGYATEPGTREYTWSVDTLYSPPGGWVYNMWGSSPNDVWAVVNTGMTTLWHYNGEEWSGYPERVAPALYSIYGFARDDVWAGSFDGKIYHYDGQQWQQSHRYSKEGYYIRGVTDIRGSSPSDVYAVGTAQKVDGGYVGFILHNDGTGWREVLITEFEIQFNRVRVDAEAVIIHATKAGLDGNTLFRLIDGNLDELVSVNYSEGRLGMNELGETTYFMIKHSLYRFMSDRLVPVMTFSDQDVIIFDGRHEQDIFLHTSSGVMHYDGDSMEYLLTVPEDMNRNVFRSVFFENEVFFYVPYYDQGTNLIYHGTLNE
ncbi:MAG: hypothetical protein WD267_11935 [Balneolales bacterium]